MNQSLNILRNIPTVKMLVWFILRDDPTSTWQSGLINRNGTRKPAFSSFASKAKPLDARSPIVRAKLNKAPIVRLSVLELAARNGAGTPIGANIKVFGPNSQFFGNIQMQSTIAKDGWAIVHVRPERHEADLLPLLRHPGQERQRDRAPGHARHR